MTWKSGAWSRGECQCLPGALEDGWMEDRCEACLATEQDQWRLLMDRLLRDLHG